VLRPRPVLTTQTEDINAEHRWLLRPAYLFGGLDILTLGVNCRADDSQSVGLKAWVIGSQPGIELQTPPTSICAGCPHGTRC
jgi:hypothetical protein